MNSFYLELPPNFFLISSIVSSKDRNALTMTADADPPKPRVKSLMGENLTFGTLVSYL